MTTNKLRPIHAGEILREEFLAQIGITPRINDVVRVKRAITVDTAMHLARFFDITV